MLYCGRQGSSSQLSPPRLASTRVRTNEAGSATPAGWLLSWCGGRVFTKICMPPRRCLLSWPRGRTSPRRCSPSWWAGSCMGTTAESWQMWAWLRPRRCLRQESCRGPGKGLAVASWSSPARTLSGVLWICSARIPPRVAVFWSSSDPMCYDPDKDLHATTKVPPEPWLQCSCWRRLEPLGLKGGSLCWRRESCPGKALAGAAEVAPARALLGESTSPLCSLVFLVLALPRLS